MKIAGNIQSWSELMEWFDESREKGWLFRGEVSQLDGLVPKIGMYGEAG